jgi:MerR family redox-sensitive transcriptional activator SoxR
MSMKIGEMAKRSDLPASTIWYYERIGLLPAPSRESGQRVYHADTVEYLKAIAIAQSFGFTLEEIKTFLGTFRAGEDPSRECQQMAQMKIQELEELIRKAERMKQILAHGLSCQCSSLNGCYVSEPIKVN